jgi:hypothetical protein
VVRERGIFGNDDGVRRTTDGQSDCRSMGRGPVTCRGRWWGLPIRRARIGGWVPLARPSLLSSQRIRQMASVKSRPAGSRATSELHLARGPVASQTRGLSGGIRCCPHFVVACGTKLREFDEWHAVARDGSPLSAMKAEGEFGDRRLTLLRRAKRLDEPAGEGARVWHLGASRRHLGPSTLWAT